MVKTQNVDTDLLNEYIEKSGLRLDYIFGTLGISRQSFDKKRKGITSFTGAEVYVLCDLLHIPNEISPKIFCI